MKIFTKLILALLLTSLMILTIIFTVVQLSFDRGMLEYVNQKQLENLQQFSDNLSRYYQKKGSWQHLLAGNDLKQVRPQQKPFSRNGQPRSGKHVKTKPSDGTIPQSNSSWMKILRLSEQGENLPANIDNYLNNKADEYSSGPPRPPRDKRRDTRPPHQKEGRGREGPPPEFGREAVKPALLDADKVLIIGHHRENFSLKSIELDNKIIGYLALPPAIHLTDKFDLAFAKQMQKNMLYTFFGFFVLIILIALPLSRHFVLPIKRLERSMRLLNKGDFKVNLKVTGKDELASLSQNFNDLAQTLEQNEYSRNRWLANISHELRTPIAIIKSEIEAIEDGIRAFDLQSFIHYRKKYSIYKS